MRCQEHRPGWPHTIPRRTWTRTKNGLGMQCEAGGLLASEAPNPEEHPRAETSFPNHGRRRRGRRRPRRSRGARLRRGRRARRKLVPRTHAAPDLRGEAIRRGLLLRRRREARVPERAAARESVLPDLPARSRHRRHSRGVDRRRQDDLRLHPSRRLGDPVRVDPPRPALGRAAAAGARLPRFRPGAPLRLGLRPGDGDLRRVDGRRRTAPADRRPRLRRRRRLLPGRRVDRLRLHPRRLQPGTLRARSEPAGSRSRVLRRDLRHARRRQRTDPAHERARIRRRPLLLRRRLPHRVAALRRGRPDRRRVVDEPRRLGPAATDRLRRDELGAVPASLGRVHPLRLEQARLRELRGVHRRHGRHEGTCPRHLHRPFRRPARAVAGRRQAGLDLQPARRRRRPALHRRLEPRGGARGPRGLA